MLLERFICQLPIEYVHWYKMISDISFDFLIEKELITNFPAIEPHNNL